MGKSSPCCWAEDSLLTHAEAFIARPPYSRSKSGLEQAADRTALACSKVDDLVACSAFLPAPQDENRRLLQERKRRLYAVASVGGNGGCSGLAYLAASEPASSAAVAIWEGCFNSLLAAYRDGGADDANGGSYGDTGATLSSIAAELDRHIAALAHETGLHQGSDPSIMRNALEMQAALERFLASQRRISEAATKERGMASRTPDL